MRLLDPPGRTEVIGTDFACAPFEDPAAERRLGVDDGVTGREPI